MGREVGEEEEVEIFKKNMIHDLDEVLQPSNDYWGRELLLHSYMHICKINTQWAQEIDEEREREYLCT